MPRQVKFVARPLGIPWEQTFWFQEASRTYSCHGEPTEYSKELRGHDLISLTDASGPSKCGKFIKRCDKFSSGTEAVVHQQLARYPLRTSTTP